MIYKVIDLQQNTPEWHEYRKSHIGASDAPIIMGISPWMTANDLWKEKMGFIDPKPMTSMMLRGQQLEPEVRKMVIEEKKINFVPITIESRAYHFLSASLDGMSDDRKIILEIKCPNKLTHEETCRGDVSRHYYTQVQHQLFVSGADECLFVSYRPKSTQELAYVTILSDPDYINEIIDRETKFFISMCKMEEFDKIEYEVVHSPEI